MSFEIKPATRQNIKPLIGIYGESGCGKTYSALLLARGIVGKSGKIALIDSESGRGSLYADVLDGGYNTLELTSPFSPARYIEAIEAVEKSGAGVGIIDSASHEWEGIGGVLDMAAANEERSGKAGLHCWKGPKMEHAKFMLKMAQSAIPWIVCLRAKYKSRQTKGTEEMANCGAIARNQIGKTVILKDDHTSPIQAEDFIYEMTAHFEVMPDHTIHLTKQSHPTLGECFPEDYKQPITIETGRKVGEWCAGGGGRPKPQPGAPKPAAADQGDHAKAKKRLYNASKMAIGQDFDSPAAWQNWLHENWHMLEDETVENCSPARLEEITTKIVNA